MTQAASFILRKKQPRERMIERICAFLKMLGQECDWEILIRKKKKERSDPQNNALWGLAYKELGEYAGYTAPELHDHFLRAYFGEVEFEVMGKRYTRPRRTTTTDENGKKSKLSTLEFAEFFSFVQMKAAEIGCYIADPDPEYWRHQEAA